MHSIWSLLLNKEVGETLNGILHAGRNLLRSLKKIVISSRYKINKVVAQRVIAVAVALVTVFSAHLALAYTETVLGFVYSNMQKSNIASAEGANEEAVDPQGHQVEGAAVKAIPPLPQEPAPKPAPTVEKIATSSPVASAKASYSASPATGKFVSVPTSAYSSTPDQTDSTPFTTASGTRVRDGVVAANFLPIGTKIRIPEYYGNKVFVVEDRMNSRYWKKVDIWMPTRYQALQWGVRHVTVEIIN